jgi:ribonuclease HI
VLEALLDKFSYVVCNTGTPTYQKVLGGGSVLDLSIVSSSIAMTCTWSALNTTLGSDHCPTFLTIGAIGDSGEDRAARPKWKCHKADWSLYRALCKDSITSNLVVDDINVFNEKIVSAIKEAANKSIPKTSGAAKGRAKKKPLPYWTPECTKAIKLRNTARNKFNKSKNPFDGAHYRKLKGIAQRTIKDAAKQHWQSLCDTFDTNTKLGTVWRISKKMQGTGNQHIIPTLNDNVNSSKAKADLFAATFAANSDDSNFDKNFIERKKEFELNHKEEFAASIDDDETRENPLNIAFSLKELKNVLNQCKKKTSPGADTVHYEMLKELPGECLDVLLTLYNLVYSTGMLPTEWKHAIVLPIRKLEKNPTQPNSYRPISLTSCICKIMEKLVTNRLTWFLESNNLLNNAQAGFRRGRSTADQIVKLQDTIHKHNRSRGFTVGVFLDFEKAYDMLWRPGLLYKIKQLGIRANMFKFVKAFISERTFQVQVGSVLSEIAVQQNGTPQGSIISPMLFLIMINDLKLNIPGVELSLFADDSATYKSGKNLNKIVNDIQRGLDEVTRWCDNWGLKISPAKSCGVIFTNRLNVNIKKPLTIRGELLKMENKVKFLGMFFDRRLTWLEHVNYIVGKCNSRLNLMRSLTGTSWGASKKCLLTIYRVLIRSLLDYGAVAMDSAIVSAKKKLETVQCKALRICCGAMTGTPLSALQNECGEMPLELRRTRQLLQYAVKIKNNEQHPANQILKDHWTNYFITFELEREPFNYKIANFFDTHNIALEPAMTSTNPPWVNRDICVDVSLSNQLTKQDPPEIIKTIAIERMNQYINYLAMYTDGSKDLHGRVGSAVYIPELDVQLSVRIDDDLSVYTSELHAILLCLNWISDNLTMSALSDDRPVAIFSDSLSACLSLDNGKSKSRPNLVNSILDKYNDLKSCLVTVVWIPSHVNIRGNEIADMLAKRATGQPAIEKAVKFEARETHELINSYVQKLWQNKWDKCKTGKFNRLLNSVVNQNIKYVNTSRQKEITITRLRLGRCRLNYYLHHIGKHETGLCDKCRVPETIEHFLMHCINSPTRDKIRSMCQKESVNFDITDILNSRKVIDAFYSCITQVI